MKQYLNTSIFSFLYPWYHFALAFIGAVVYGFPSKSLTVIGVTGTDGKSTTVEMVTRILREGGFSVCSTSSVWFQIGDEKKKNTLKMGMPGRFFLQRFLRKAVNQGCTHAVIEVSSEGILQHRHRFIDFDTAVITNLSPEHIERHGSFEKYRTEKEKLFSAARNVLVVNGDDENAPFFVKDTDSKKVYVYEVAGGFNVSGDETVVRAETIAETKEGTKFEIDGLQFYLQLLGKFNVYNALAAVCVGLSQSISLEVCRQALVKMPGMPGRMELVSEHPFPVIIDYAVTPKALQGLYQAIRRLFEPTRMVCVLGSCGGGRDSWKRPVLGKIASQYCDTVILTNEDPYDEDPQQIIDHIAKGVTKPTERILDRRQAINRALSIANEGDIVVITGKGSEDAIAMAEGKKIPWNEKSVVLEEWKALGLGEEK